MERKAWTPQEIELVKDVTLTSKEIAEKIGRTEAGVKFKRHTLGIKAGTHPKIKTKIEIKTPKVKSTTKSTIGSRIKALRTSAKIRI